MTHFQVPFKKVSLLALFSFFGAFGFAAHNHDLTLDTLDNDRLILNISSAYNQADTADLGEQWGIAEDLFEPVDIVDAENVINLSLEDGTSYDITLPQQWDDSDDEAERTINLELADGVRISIFVPRKERVEQPNVFAAAEENSFDPASGTVTLSLPDGTSMSIVRPATPTRAAATNTRPKPDRVGVGEDLTDIPDINDPEGLIVELPGGSTVLTQDQ